VEQDPLAIWDSVRRAAAAAVAAARASHGELSILALGITNQRETTVVWDRLTGAPLHHAVVWLDGRTAGVCAEAAAAHGGADAFRPVTGLPVSTYFSAYKLAWLLRHAPRVAAAAEEGRCMFGTVDSWLVYNLTGGAGGGGAHVTDVTNASRTNLMELSTLTWHAPTVAAFGAGRVLLPAIRSNAEVLGHVAPGAVPELAGVPISGCLGDQQAAMLGQRCGEREAKNTYGTGCFLLLHTGAAAVPSTHGLLTTVAHRLGPAAAPAYALEGAVAIAGQGISWLRDGLGVIESAADSEAVAGSVADSGGVYFVPAFSGLLAPWWAPDARGAILGLTQGTTRAHIVRAMLEAICFQTRDVLEAMARDAGGAGELGCLLVDGGASCNALLMQLQADLLQVPVRRPANLETTSLGAALAAGIGAGVWSEREALGGRGKEGGTLFSPRIGAGEARARHARWALAVERSLGLAALGPDAEGEAA
jgi:glycerol kinase